MNYLIHLYLSAPAPDEQLGNLMGDFVKGRLPPELPPGFRRGIARHRQIDSFAHTHPAFRRSKNRLDPAYRHCRSIMVDIFYDHFLARDWECHAGLPLEAFAQGVYRLLEVNHSRLPAGLQVVAPRMIAHDWLVSYRNVEVIGQVLVRMATRLRYPTKMGEGLPELLRNYQALQNDFEEFLADAAAMFPPTWR